MTKQIDLTEEVGDYQLSEYYKNKTMNGIGELNYKNIKSALVYALLWGLLAILLQIQEVGSIWKLDWKGLVDAGIMAGLATIITIIKKLFTTNDGNFLGVVKVE